MALTERFENDKIEIIGPYKTVQVRKANIIEKDGVEVMRTFERNSFMPGDLDENNTWVDADLSQEGADVQAVCAAVWTTEVKDAYKAYLIQSKETSSSEE